MSPLLELLSGVFVLVYSPQDRYYFLLSRERNRSAYLCSILLYSFDDFLFVLLNSSTTSGDCTLSRVCREKPTRPLLSTDSLSTACLHAMYAGFPLLSYNSRSHAFGDTAANTSDSYSDLSPVS